MRRSVVGIVGLFSACAVVLCGCGGSDDDVAAGGDANVDAIVEVLMGSLSDINGIGSDSAQGQAGRIVASATTFSCAGTGANPWPCTINVAVNEPMPCASGSGSYSGNMKITLGSPTSFSATFTLTASYNGCVLNGYTLGNTIYTTGTFSGDPSAGSVTFKITWDSNNFSVDGVEYRIFLTANGTITQDGSVAGSITGSINGQSINESL